MVWKKYSVELELTGITRKRAAELFAEQFESPPKYSFDGDRYTVTDTRGREWFTLPSPDIRAEKWSNGRMVGANHLYQVKVCTPFLYESEFDTLAEMLERLETGGASLNESTNMAVLLDMTGLASQSKFIDNLSKIYESKGALLQKAIGKTFDNIADCSMLEETGGVALPLFPASLNPEDVRGYIQLSQGICGFAVKSKAIRNKENDSPNEKFQLRTWLVRLGFVGEEYKHARKMLTENLSGNSAWLRKMEPALENRQEETVLNPVLENQQNEAVPEAAQENHQEDTEETGGRDMESPESSEEDNAPILPENEITM